MHAAAAAMLLLVVAPVATAGADTYTVSACRSPAGAVVGAAGWSGTKAGSAEATNGCAPTGLGVALIGNGPWEGGSGANQQFTAPADTRIVRLQLQRVTKGLAPSASKAAGYFVRADDRVLEGCAPGPGSTCIGDLAGDLDAPGLDAASVRFNAGCGAFFPDVCGGAALRVDVGQATVTLRDTLAPTVSNITTSATDGAATKVTVKFDAADRGGGLYRRLVRIDGTVVDAQPLGAGTCVDASPSDADPYQFLAPTPCPATAGAVTTTVDLATLSKGEHAVEVLVEDAAGNTTAAFGPVTLPRLNAETPTGAVAGASAEVDRALTGRLYAYFVANGKRRYAARYGRRVVIRGNLVDRRRRPISGARIDVYHVLGGTRRLVKTGLKTRRGGRFTTILPLNVGTRDILFVYRALRPGRATSKQRLRLTVRDGDGRLVTKPLNNQGPRY